MFIRLEKKSLEFISALTTARSMWHWIDWFGFNVKEKNGQ